MAEGAVAGGNWRVDCGGENGCWGCLNEWKRKRFLDNMDEKGLICSFGGKKQRRRRRRRKKGRSKKKESLWRNSKEEAIKNNGN